MAGLRIASAWLAGMNKMRWPTFLFWNALGGIAWAASVALSIYFLGNVAERRDRRRRARSAPAVGVAAARRASSLYRRQRRRAVEARTTSSGADGE